MTPEDPLRALAIGYAQPRARIPLATLFALDDKFSAILRSTREPLVGQMRLTWWYEALVRLDTAPPPAEPLLRTLFDHVLPTGVSGAKLAELSDGWDILLEPELDDAAIDRFSVRRGRKLFELAGTVLAVVDDRIGLAGEGWALADLALRTRTPTDRARAQSWAMERIDRALEGRWPTAARALGAMTLSARLDASQSSERQGGASHVARLAWHRLTGY